MKNIEQGAAVWEQDVVIPTYPVGEPEKNPMFLEKRVYQGSSGKVYPNPIIDKIYDHKVDKTYRALCLENKYLFIAILPELGGRVQRAYDKTNGYDFVYYNHVIKPALVGLCGPWISGGIEFNWPQHHRPSTYEPVDYTVREHADGSRTVYVSEIELMFRTKGTAAFTLHPDRAYLEISARIYNRTSLPQTFLWWANPAVAVNDHTQSVFPPDVHAVMDHGKRAVSRFPIATGVYYKHDYSAGVDISRYKNIPVPTSYMAYHSDYDFVGGYDHGRRAGILHVADHHISPGKKQWTWGCGDFGQAWDRNLTDEDGPYIELMTGCFTDNQPDFTWLAPYEEKTFTQYFMPYKDIGVVKNATIHAAVNLELEADAVLVQAYATRELPGARIVLQYGDKTLLEHVQPLSPCDTFTQRVPLPQSCRQEELYLCVYGSEGELLVDYRPDEKKLNPIPDPAQEVPLPGDCKTTEDLLLYGLHLEQYRHATYLPEDYYREGLRRDPTDIRLNNAYGCLLMRRGCLEEAAEHFEAAVKKLTRSNPNPYDGEPLYNLGVCLKLMGLLGEAYDRFYKATWNGPWQQGAFYHMACISAVQGDFTQALAHVEASLARGWHNMKARDLKAALLRKLDRAAEARSWVRQSLDIDVMDYAARLELALLDNNHDAKKELLDTVSRNPHWAIELALEYSDAGFYREAAGILQGYVERHPGCDHPLVFYHLAYATEKAGDDARELYARAAAAPGDRCFPHRLEDLLVLQRAVTLQDADGMAWYYLGNLWYDKRQYARAVSCWERARDQQPSFPTVRRNLSLAYYNKLGRPEDARRELERAFALDTSDSRVFMELDQLCKKLGDSAARRLERYEQHLELVEQRDDLYLEYVTLHNYAGNHARALELIERHKFHPIEGAEGKVPAQYSGTLVELAKEALAAGDAAEAVKLLERSLTFPHNLGEGKLAGAQDNNIYYTLGLACEQLGDNARAQECFAQASTGLDEPAGMMYYYDQPPETIYYQGLALQKLGRTEAAASRFNKLIGYGEEHIFDKVRIDYFAVSLPDMLIFDEDLDKKNRVHCLFMMALGHLGKGENMQAQAYMEEARSLDPNHLGIRLHCK